MILVFGSINVDLVVPVERLPHPGETVLGGDYAVVPGGKGANQALAARRAGAIQRSPVRSAPIASPQLPSTRCARPGSIRAWCGSPIGRPVLPRSWLPRRART